MNEESIETLYVVVEFELPAADEGATPGRPQCFTPLGAVTARIV